jgi:hypothetical protein
MSVSRVLDLCTHSTVHLERLELRKQLVHTVRFRECRSPVMVIIREYGHISPHVVHNHHEPLKHGIYGPTGEMGEVLVLSPVGRKEPGLNLSGLGMSILQLLPNPARQVLYLNPFEFKLTQRMVQVVDRLVVGVEHVTRSWSKEVRRMNISCVHCDIP